MRLSDKTIAILKNFATINQSIALKAGSTIRTMSQSKTILASAVIDEEFPQNAAIYDLNRFLSVLSLYKAPEIEFKDDRFVISEDKRTTKYVYTNPEMIVTPPEKDIKLPSVDVEIDLKWDDIQSVLKAAGVFGLPEIAFVGTGGKVYLRTLNVSDPSSDTYDVLVGETEDTFRMIIKVENIKLIPGDYKVSISTKGISEFAAGPVKYFIAVDTKSTYNKAV